MSSRHTSAPRDLLRFTKMLSHDSSCIALFMHLIAIKCNGFGIDLLVKCAIAASDSPIFDQSLHALAGRVARCSQQSRLRRPAEGHGAGRRDRCARRVRSGQDHFQQQFQPVHGDRGCLHLHCHHELRRAWLEAIPQLPKTGPAGVDPGPIPFATEPRSAAIRPPPVYPASPARQSRICGSHRP